MKPNDGNMMMEGSEKNAGGWRFVPVKITVVAIPEDADGGDIREADPKACVRLASIVEGAMMEDARSGAGLFEGAPAIPAEDEELDKYLGVEAYGIKCTLSPFLDALRRHGVAAVNEAFLSIDMTRLLFDALHQAAAFMSGHTDKPQAVRNEISRLDGLLGELPIWGLFLQILFMDGLRRLLEGVKDGGADEAASIHKWTVGNLIDRIVIFAHTPYGENDKRRLAPLGDFLADTWPGRKVQEHLFGEPQPEEARRSTPTMPAELQTDEAARMLGMAMDEGLINDRYEWRKGVMLLACFAREASLYLGLGKGENADGTPRISWKPFETFFGIEQGTLRLRFKDVTDKGNDPKEAFVIDRIFRRLRG